MVYFLLVDKKYTETEKVDIDEILLEHNLTKYDNNGILLNKEKAEELDYRWSMNSIEKLKKSFEKGFFNGIIYIITEFFLDFSYNILSLKNKTLLYDLHIIINYISNSTDITKQQQLLSMIRYGLILFPFGFLFTTISKIAGYINFIGRKNTKKQIQVFNERID